MLFSMGASNAGSAAPWQRDISGPSCPMAWPTIPQQQGQRGKGCISQAGGHSAPRRAQSHPEEGGVLRLSALQPGHEQGFLALSEGRRAHLLCAGRQDSPFLNLTQEKLFSITAAK